MTAAERAALVATGAWRRASFFRGIGRALLELELGDERAELRGAVR